MLDIPQRPQLLETKREPQEPKDPQVGKSPPRNAQDAKNKAAQLLEYGAALEKYEQEKKDANAHNNGIWQKNHEIWRKWFDNLPQNPLMNKIMEMVRDRYDNGEMHNAATYLDELIELVQFAHSVLPAKK